MKARCVLLATVLLATSAAEAGSISRLSRRLAPEESAALAAAQRSVVGLVMDAATRAGQSCKVVEWNSREVDVPVPTSALAAPGALYGLFPSVKLHCDEKPGRFDYLWLKLHVAVDPRNRAEFGPQRRDPVLPARGMVSVPGRDTASGDSRVFLNATSALLALDIHGEPKPGKVLARLDEALLLAALDRAGPLPPPARYVPPRDASALTPQKRREAERAVVEEVIANVAGDGSAVVVTDSAPGAIELDEAIPDACPDIDPLLLRRFAEEQRTGDPPSLPGNAMPVDDKIVDALLEKGPDRGWKNFYAQYPNAKGRLELSPVSFNASGDQAAVVFGIQRGSLDGIGAFYVLRRTPDGRWKVLYESVLWLS